MALRYLNARPSQFLIRALAVMIAIIFATPRCASAQNEGPSPIRVESNEVLVPVLVFNLDRWNAAVAQDVFDDPKPWEESYIRNLTATDFQVFEDGKEQKIRRATLEPSHISQVSDNYGTHYEYSDAGEGKWAYPDLPADGVIHSAVLFPYYVLAYNMPGPADESCHRVSVKVRHHVYSWVGAPHRYCRISIPATDPLRGTKLGAKMDRDLLSGNLGKIPLSVAAATLFGPPNQTRVLVSIVFPPGRLAEKFDSDNDILGSTGLTATVTKGSGRTLATLSTIDCCDWHEPNFGTFVILESPGVNDDVLQTPSGYQTQLTLPPGQYNLSIIVSDGDNFGRADVPIQVEAPAGQNLSISDVALAKRFRQAQPKPPDATAESRQSFTPPISKGVEYPLAADSRFQKGQPFFFYFEVYEPQISATPTPAIRANLRIVDATTNEVKIERLNFDVSSYILPGNPIIPIGDGIDIRSLPPGNYRLEVQASDSSGQSTPWHSAAFSIQ